jgi:hypothetical protein
MKPVLGVGMLLAGGAVGWVLPEGLQLSWRGRMLALDYALRPWPTSQHSGLNRCRCAPSLKRGAACVFRSARSRSARAQWFA